MANQLGRDAITDVILHEGEIILVGPFGHAVSATVGTLKPDQLPPNPCFGELVSAEVLHEVLDVTEIV